MLNLHHLRLFRAVAHDGTLTGAAQRLHLSPSALSSQLKTLEETLGQALFSRVGRGLALTEAGRIALDHADVIFATVDDLTQTLRDTGTPRRALRVGALATLSRNFQMAFLRPALGRTDTEIVLRAGSQGELLRALDSLALDVVLTNLAPPVDAASPFTAARLAEQPVGLIGTPRRLAGRDLPTLLRHEPLVLPAPGTALRAGFDTLVAEMQIAPRIAAEADDMAMMRLLAREDAGLAVLPPIVVQDELTAGLLVDAHRLPGIVETFLAVTRGRRFPNPLVAALVAAFRG